MNRFSRPPDKAASPTWSTGAEKRGSLIEGALGAG